jgi:membrane-associated phospholipid phosphatase
VPGSAAATNPRSSAAQIIRRKIWEWNAGWMGLALALASAWCATQGLKVLIGKPRPDLIARCDPDLSLIDKYTVGGLGGKVDGGPVLVSWEICRDQSNSLKIDGFSSFPSGHSSCGFSFFVFFLCLERVLLCVWGWIGFDLADYCLQLRSLACST